MKTLPLLTIDHEQNNLPLEPHDYWINIKLLCNDLGHFLMFDIKLHVALSFTTRH